MGVVFDVAALEGATAAAVAVGATAVYVRGDGSGGVGAARALSAY